MAPRAEVVSFCKIEIDGSKPPSDVLTFAFLLLTQQLFHTDLQSASINQARAFNPRQPCVRSSFPIFYILL